MTADEEEQGLEWWMNSIPASGDDMEIWRLEGALQELAYYRDHEAETEEQKAETRTIISALNRRRQRVVEEVRA